MIPLKGNDGSQRVVIRIYLLFALQVFLKPLVTNDDDDDDDDNDGI